MKSSGMVAKMTAILDFTKKLRFIGKSQIYFARSVKYDTTKHFSTFSSSLYVFFFFIEKNNT